jgi:predicted Zn finger-like uncharacterized protein
MRIQCKKCGKEYRVDESRLTLEGVRVKCRDCGAVLLVRKRAEQGPAVEEQVAAPQAGAEAAAHEAPESSEASAYHYCVACGRELDRVVSPGKRPVCTGCESIGGKKRLGPVGDVIGVPASMPAKTRPWLYALIFGLLIIAAVMGYRFAHAGAWDPLPAEKPSFGRAFVPHGMQITFLR